REHCVRVAPRLADELDAPQRQFSRQKRVPHIQRRDADEVAVAAVETEDQQGSAKILRVVSPPAPLPIPRHEKRVRIWSLQQPLPQLARLRELWFVPPADLEWVDHADNRCVGHPEAGYVAPDGLIPMPPVPG